MDNEVKQYLALIGRKGGKKSRRTLTSADARNMVRVREARRAYKKYWNSCFWSFRRDLKIQLTDIPWIAEQLMKNGNREAWFVGKRLCH